MKVLITGATGLLGRSVFNQLKQNKNMEVTGLGFSRAEPPLKKLDLTVKEDLKRFVDRSNTDLIVHCAAERRPDVSEADPEASEYLNVEVTRNLAEIAGNLGSKMIYISTDYVFDGKNPPYFTDSDPNPLNFYGKTKLAGEKAVFDNLTEGIVLRVPILYGSELYPRESSIGTVSANLKEKSGGRFDDIAVRYPTHTEDVAIVLERIITAVIEDVNVSGIYHFSGPEAMSKYKMAVIMAEIMGIDPKAVISDKTDTGSTIRPVDSHLDNSRLGKLMKVPGRSFVNGIEPLLKSLYNL